MICYRVFPRWRSPLEERYPWSSQASAPSGTTLICLAPNSQQYRAQAVLCYESYAITTLLVATFTARLGVVCQDVSYLPNPANKESPYTANGSYASSAIFAGLRRHHAYAILRRIQVSRSSQMFPYSLARVPYAQNGERDIHS